jgi:tRNA dimethylallyltransferase
VPEIDADIRQAVREMPVADAHKMLSALDPDAAVRLSANDRSRVARALEVVQATGKTLSHWQKQQSGGISETYRVSGAVLLPPRDWLFERIDRRFAEMVEGDGVAEIADLLARALDPALPVMRAIGVREIQSYIETTTLKDEAIARGQLATRQYAKRQFTWFRNQTPLPWERIEAQLNRDNLSDLVIKLRDYALTS